ncbi:MAG: VirB4 family type IV secretion system protein [Candidatus Saccharimonadales bacterium]
MIKLKKLAEPNKAQYLLGEQTIINQFSYSGLKEYPDYLVIDGKYIRCLFISGYPYVATSGWMDNLIHFGHDIDISFHLHEISALLALPKLYRKITELESTKRAMIKAGKIVGSEIIDPLSSASELRDKILRGQEKLFQVSVYIAIRESTLKDLNRVSTLLESTMSSRLFQTRAARYQQLEALQSILPRATDQLNYKRNLDSSSAALTFPFMSSELVHPSGILFGINKSNDSLVIIDRFSLNNANSIVFAQSGSGKSYLTKVEILRQLTNGTKVIVIDPEREYQNLSESVKGTYIKLSLRSKQRINPLDPISSNLSPKQISEHIHDVTAIVSLLAEGLSPREKANVDKALVTLLTANKKRPPLLNNLYTALKKLKQLKLCERLEKYISGSMAEIFNSQTNIKLDNRLIVFDIKDMPDSLRQAMMLIIANFVSNKVKSQPEKRLLVIDEAWLLLEHDDSARFIAGLVRRARKYYLGVSIISQQANDFLNSNYGRAIASQSALRILMRQDSTTIKNVVSEFTLSEYERHYLLSTERGECLMIVDQNHVAVKIVASSEEHPLITTDPSELYDNK